VVVGSGGVQKGGLGEVREGGERERDWERGRERGYYGGR
jgi:hypothetical protein